MKERRAEPRLLCSDLIKVRLEGENSVDLIANLEDISPSGARLLFERAIPAGARISLKLGRYKFHGEVRYSTHDEIGHFAGVQFDSGRKWSRQMYEPEHMLDPARMVTRAAKPADPKTGC